MNTTGVANLVMIAGIPAAIGLCAWGLTEIIASGKILERVATSIEAQQRQLSDHSSRIDRLEDTYIRK